MSSKPKTIAAAEKRVIKSEITSLRKAVRKILADRKQAQSAILREIRGLERKYTKITNSCRRESEAATRRIAILEGRL